MSVLFQMSVKGKVLPLVVLFKNRRDLTLPVISAAFLVVNVFLMMICVSVYRLILNGHGVFYITAFT